MHDLHKARDLCGRQSGKWADSPHQPLDSCRVRICHQTNSPSEPGCGDHSPADCFAVQIFAISGGRFERMGKRVAEIQYLAQAGFAFVAAHHPRLNLYATWDHEIESLGVAIHKSLD